MNFYYHPILGLQYNPVFAVEKGSFFWDSADKDNVFWYPNESGMLSISTLSKDITLN